MVDSLTLSSIFFLGCIHAFEPGHGKSFLMAYTVSGKLNLKKSFLLSISLIISHFFILTIISILYNLFISELINDALHGFSHWFGPSLIFLYGFFIVTRSFYKKKHKHSEGCGHLHGKFRDTKLGSPIIVGLITGLLPCASSLAVVMITGQVPSISSTLRFISIYVFGIAIILFFTMILFNFASHFFKSKIDGLSKNLDAEMLSGILIIGVSIIYFSYNIFGGSH